MTNECVYKNDGEMLVGSKTLKCSYCAETAYVDLKNAPPGYVYEYKKPDYSKMYFIFQFKDGKTAKYRMDKDCHNLQQFLDRMNKFHELEKENKRLKKQLNEANKLLKYCCANYESSRFGATITEDGEILPKGPVWNYLKKWGVK